MPKNSLDQFAKLMVDPKVNAILKVTKSASGLSTKQIASATKIPTNQLYYTINKMLDADLLTIVNQVQVKNLTENYYSSKQLTHEGAANQTELDQIDRDLTNISGAWSQTHAQEMLRWIMLLNREFNETFKEQMTIDHPELATVFMSHSTLELSAAGEHQLRLDLIKVLADAEKNDPDPDAPDKKTAKITIEKWA